MTTSAAGMMNIKLASKLEQYSPKALPPKRIKANSTLKLTQALHRLPSR